MTGHSMQERCLSDFCDGSRFPNHPLYAGNPNSIQLILYYDDVELCNPLGSKRSIHKLGNESKFIATHKYYNIIQFYAFITL